MELKSDLIYKSMLDSGWNFSKELFNSMSSYEQSFVENEFTGLRSLDYYKSRLSQIGFTNKNRVLDAACGMGQWSLAMAKLNNSVDGIDLNSGRIEVAKHIASNSGFKNVNFQVGSIDKLPFEDNSFDAVFCYGSFMFTNMQQTLAEFHRVLRPGGLIYLNANGFGWYLHLIVSLGLLKGNFKLAKVAWEMIFGYLTGRTSQVMVLPRDLKKMGKLLSLTLISLAHEGGICLNKAFKVNPAYKTRYFGFVGIWEVLWKKD